jgi:hypothetical protein
MKKLITCLLLLALALPIDALAATEEEKAWPIAVAAIENELGMSMDELVLYDSGVWNEGYSDRAWSFSFHLKEPKETHTNLVQVGIKADGSVSFVNGPEEFALWQLLGNRFRKLLAESPAETCTVEMMAALKTEWEPRLPEWIAELNETQEAGHHLAWSEYIALALNQDICLPGDDVIPLDAARKLAEEYIVAMPDWTQAHLDMLARYFEIYYISGELGKPVYAFAFSRVKSSSGKYENKDWDYYEKDYLKPLYAMFGGENGYAPRYVVLRVDAKTGALIEAPHVEFPGANTVDEFAFIK